MKLSTNQDIRIHIFNQGRFFEGQFPSKTSHHGGLLTCPLPPAPPVFRPPAPTPSRRSRHQWLRPSWWHHLHESYAVTSVIRSWSLYMYIYISFLKSLLLPYNTKLTKRYLKRSERRPCTAPQKKHDSETKHFCHLCNVHRWWWASATSQVGKLPTKNQTQSLPQSHQKPRSWAQTPNKRA